MPSFEFHANMGLLGPNPKQVIMPHKIVTLLFKLVVVNNKLTIVWGS